MSNANNTNRISALKRIGKSPSVGNNPRHHMTGSIGSSMKDARQLLIHRSPSSSPFDARQLLNRQSSNIFNSVPTNITVRRNTEEIDDDNNDKMVVVTGLKNMKVQDGRLIPAAQTEQNKKIYAVGPTTFVTIRNKNSNAEISSNSSTEKISLTKTITNSIVRREDDNNRSQTTNTLSSLSNQKVVISFVNDQYQKTPKAPQITTTTTTTTAAASSSSLSHYRRDSPPVIKRLHDASIQTSSPSSSSRSPIRMSSHRRLPATDAIDEQDYIPNRTIDDDLYEPPVKRTTSTTRKTTIDTPQQYSSATASTGAVKRTSAGTPIISKTSSSTSTVSKPISTTESQSIPGTILVTNLVSSVSEEDVIELFGQIGRINEITTLSQGCVQIVYAKREYAEQAVTKYHNRLLDGQFMYVCLQQTSSSSSSSNIPKQTTKPTNNIQQPPKPNGTSNNSSSTTNQPLKLNSTGISSTKISLDPAFIRQALFHPSNNTTNPVQFQVKL